jgi:TRAP-type C4-dicarboxylate transport system substrate-binding protein
LNLTGHIQSSIQILVNERVWQRLSGEQQTALQQTIRELGLAVREGTLRDEQAILARWREEGVLQVVDDVDLDAFRNRAMQYFATGFPFSRLYQTINRQEVLPRTETPSVGPDLQRTAVEQEDAP